MEIKYVYASTEVLIGILSWVASAYLFLSGSHIKEQYRSLGGIEFSVGTMLFCDGLAWYFDGVPGKSAFSVLNVSNLFTFSCNAIIPLMYCLYIVMSIDKEDRDVRIMYVIGVIAALTELFLVSSYTSGYIYWIDPVTNTYQRGEGFGLWSVLFLVPVLISVAYVVYNRRLFTRRRFNVILLFALIPILAAIINIFVGMSLSNYAIAGCVLVMFLQVLQDNVSIMLEQQARIKIQDDELADMRNRIALSQIKPHFLYNTLNSIYVLCDVDKEQAKKVVNNLADYLRQNIGSIESKEPIPFEKELEHTKVYLEIEKVRFADRFDVEYHINAKDFVIPALTVQPLAENAVKHGLCKKKLDEKGLLIISSDDMGDYYSIRIEDNGVGFDVEEYNNREIELGQHIGLRNVRDRMKIMENADLLITSKEGVGTKIEIRIPK